MGLGAVSAARAKSPPLETIQALENARLAAQPAAEGSVEPAAAWIAAWASF